MCDPSSEKSSGEISKIWYLSLRSTCESLSGVIFEILPVKEKRVCGCSSVRNGAVRPSWARTRMDDISSSRPVFSWTCPTSKSQGPGRTTLSRPPPSPVVPCRPLSSPAVFRCFPMFSDVFRGPPPSLAVLCSYLPSPGTSCLRSWGSSSLLMTAVLGIQGRGRTTFCRPVSSGGLGSPPPGPTGPRTAENTGL